MIKAFFYKFLLFLFPIFLMLLFYIYIDPFHIIHRYEYSKNYHVAMNRDIMSGEVYINQRTKYHYNSFIFGNSRTLGYPIKSWQQHLGKEAIPFKFDAAGETLAGIYAKIKYIDSQKDTLKNVLLIFCQAGTFTDVESSNVLSTALKHPKISNTSTILVHGQFLKEFFNYYFFSFFMLRYFTGNEYEFMPKYKNKYGIQVDSVTNDIWMQKVEDDLKENPQEYYKKNEALFFRPNHAGTYSLPEITTPQEIGRLKEIKALFDKHKTNYKIVISPLYNQIYMSSEDVNLLQNIFGDSTVYNYSGKNSYTDNKENYYEYSHYRQHIGEAIMNDIYKK